MNNDDHVHDHCTSAVTYHSREKKAAILFKILVCLMDGEIFKWESLTRDALLKITKMP